MQSLCYHRSWLQQENSPLAHGAAPGSRQGQAVAFFFSSPLLRGRRSDCLGPLPGRRHFADRRRACIFRRPRDDSVVGHGGNGFFGSRGGNGDRNGSGNGNGNGSGSGNGNGSGSGEDGEKNHPSSFLLPNALFLAFLPRLSSSLSPESRFLKPWPIPPGWMNLIGSLLLFIFVARSRPLALAESNPNLNSSLNSIANPKPELKSNPNPNSSPNRNSNPNPNLSPNSNPKLNPNLNGEDGRVVVWEVKSGKWRRLVMDPATEGFVVDVVVRSEEDALAYDLEQLVASFSSSASKKVAEKNAAAPAPCLDNAHFQKTPSVEHEDDDSGGRLLWRSASRTVAQCWNLIQDVMLPEGYPTSVSGDYLEYSLWRMGQGIASQVNGVLTTQALLYAVGLGKGAIPTAAAVNWVLKDGIGYLSKITLSKFGRHFDVYPKGWRLFADLLENVSYGLELLTPTFPHLFVYLGALAGAGKSAAGLIQAATRSCFYAGFAAQRNYADVIAKGEAQGMVSKSIGIMLGIAMSGYVGSSGPALVAAFVTVTAVHMFCNLKSYQAVQLRSLNPYRAYLVFGEYLRSGVVPSIAEVNAAEPVIAEVSIPLIGSERVQDDSYHLSRETKEEALMLRKKLELGVTFKNLVQTRIEAEALSRIYQNERYILSQQSNRFLVLLKEGATAHDLLRMMLQVSFLLQNHARFGSVSHGVVVDCGESGILKRSYDYMQKNFDKVKDDLQSAGWIVDGLVSRPSSHRLLMKSFFEGSPCV